MKIKYYYKRKKGHNNSGKITNKSRGGGHKKLYRQIDFNKFQINISGKVKAIEYDPNRSANIAKIFYANNLIRYKISPIGLKIGSLLKASSKAPLKIGNTLPLKNIPLGTNIYNLEPMPGKGAKFVRSAGTTACIIAKSDSWITIRLPSNEVRIFSENCWATIGKVSNVDHFNKKLKKAGRSRWLGIRPNVRGCAKNSVDHPHGGGEGKAPIGRSHPVSPWGKPTLGKRTRRSKKYSDSLILRRFI